MQKYYLVAEDGSYTKESVTLEEVKDKGYTYRLRNGYLVLFFEGTVVGRGFITKLEQIMYSKKEKVDG